MGISVSQSEAVRFIELNHQNKIASPQLKLNKIHQNVIQPRNDLSFKENYPEQRLASVISNSRFPLQNIQFEQDNLLQQGQENHPSHRSKKDLSRTDKSKLTFDELIVKPNEEETPVKSGSSALRARKIAINKKK